jgi:hyperosmotically inducible periplasmic protein
VPTLECRRSLCVTAAVVATVALRACSREAPPREKLDAAIAGAQQKSDEAKAHIKAEAKHAKKTTEIAADKMARHVETAADKVISAVGDAAVTAGVSAELARDPCLHALEIGVGTNSGTVVLTGKAPDAAVRDRATRVASNVKGVVRVENRLEIGG